LVNKLIEERYAFYESKAKPATSAPSTGNATPAENVPTAPKREPVDASSMPPKKKVKRESSAVKQESSADDDAAFAARLQAEENTQSRPTRGSATRKRQTTKSTGTPSKRKKSAAKVKADDDSDIETGGEREEVKKTGAFHKPLALSQPLADLVGEQQMSRPQVVKKIWEYVKERNLQNPDDKRQIRCDEKLQAVFKQDSVHMVSCVASSPELRQIANMC